MPLAPFPLEQRKYAILFCRNDLVQRTTKLGGEEGSGLQGRRYSPRPFHRSQIPTRRPKPETVKLWSDSAVRPKYLSADTDPLYRFHQWLATPMAA